MLHGNGIALTGMVENIFHPCMTLSSSPKYLLSAGTGNTVLSLVELTGRLSEDDIRGSLLGIHIFIPSAFLLNSAK